MDTRRNNIVVTLFALAALLFTGCQEVEDLATGATPGNIQIDTVGYTLSNAQLNNKSTVTFTVSVKNLGGLDSIGEYVSAYVNNELIGQLPTGVMGSAANPEIPAQKTVSFKWKAIAGVHTASFVIKTDSTDETNATHHIELPVGVATLVVSDSVAVTAEEATQDVAEIVTAVKEDVSIAEVVANVDAILADTTTKEDNEVAVLQTLKVVAKEELTIAADVVPTKITLGTSEEDKDTVTTGEPAKEEPKVEALFIPLAKKVAVIDEITGEAKVDEVTGDTLTETAVDTGAFLITLTTEVEEVTESEMSDTGVVVTKTQKKEVAVPLAVKRDETEGTVKIENGLGGITIGKDGSISLLDLAPTRSARDEFWNVMKVQLALAATEFSTNITNGMPFFSALAQLMGEFASIASAYDLMTAVTNEKPVITVEASKSVAETREGNDLVRTSWDVFTAKVTDDKDGVEFVTSGDTEEVFNPGPSSTLEPVSYTFTAEDSDKETASVTVVSKYTSQRIVNYYVHDQGAVN